MSDYTKLRELAQAASPQDIDSAQQIEHFADGSRYATCPTCGGEGHVDIESDYCNYDGVAIGVLFYGIGNEFGAAEAYFRAATPANIIALIDEHAALSRRVAELERVLDGLPQDAIDGGWTARGMSAYSTKLEKQVAELEPAAARYRHLRECNSGSLVIVRITGMGADDQVVLTETDADTTIDAAIAAQADKGEA
jgi:hypothetical protein